MKRTNYNEHVVEECTELLKSRSTEDIYTGTILAAYLIEQALKRELKKINPLLYFDRKNISDEAEFRLASGRSTNEEIAKMPTSTPKRFIAHMCERKSELKKGRSNIEELFQLRNQIIHSIDDIGLDENSIAETAVSALRTCRKYIAQCAGITTKDFNPLTSQKFEKLEEERRKERLETLHKRIREHKVIFEKLKTSGQKKILIGNYPKEDRDTWVEKEVECPACKQASLYKVGMVDFDWSDGVVLTHGGYHYECGTCGLELSEYEYELVEREELLNSEV